MCECYIALVSLSNKDLVTLLFALYICVLLSPLSPETYWFEGEIRSTSEKSNSREMFMIVLGKRTQNLKLTLNKLKKCKLWWKKIGYLK